MDRKRARLAVSVATGVSGWWLLNCNARLVYTHTILPTSPLLLFPNLFLFIRDINVCKLWIVQLYVQYCIFVMPPNPLCTWHDLNTEFVHMWCFCTWDEIKKKKKKTVTYWQWCESCPSWMLSPGWTLTFDLFIVPCLQKKTKQFCLFLLPCFLYVGPSLAPVLWLGCRCDGSELVCRFVRGEHWRAIGRWVMWSQSVLECVRGGGEERFGEVLIGLSVSNHYCDDLPFKSSGDQ